MSIVKKIKEVILTAYCFLPLAGLAAGVDIENPIGTNSFTELLNRIIDWAIYLSIPLAGGAIIYSAFQMMSSGGDEKELDKAKRTLQWAIIGFIIILVAKGLVLAIKSILGI